MMRIYVDFNTLTSEPAGFVKLGSSSLDGLPVPAPGARVILYDEDMQVEANLLYDHAYDDWMAVPDWSTRADLDAAAVP
jgi:hypothetical protein